MFQILNLSKEPDQKYNSSLKALKTSTLFDYLIVFCKSVHIFIIS